MSAMVNVNGRICESGTRGHLGVQSQFLYGEGVLRGVAHLRHMPPLSIGTCTGCVRGGSMRLEVPISDAEITGIAFARRWPAGEAEAYLRSPRDAGVISEITYNPAATPTPSVKS